MKIVTLSTYSAQHPRHGGQHRLLNIVRSFRGAGHSVVSCGVLGAPHYPAAQGFLPYPSSAEFTRYIANPLFMDDWAIGELFASDDRHFERLASLIPEDVDAFHVEQPWLSRFARRYIGQHSRRTIRLLYGSANVEHELKRGIVSGYLGERHAKDCAALVLDCETEALRSADLVCAVSREDVAWMQSRTNADVVLAANGTTDNRPSTSAVRDANLLSGHHRFAIYCASAHPPNITSFFNMFGKGVGCFAPDERLLVAGSAGPSIQNHERFSLTPGLSRPFVSTGEVDGDCLTGLLAIAHAVLLPITQGGGTNLKTAEALWTGHHVIATPLAMRGYEQFQTAQGVSVCEDAVDFRIAIREAMGRPRLAVSGEERERRRAVLWTHTLAAYVDSVADLAR